MASAKKRTSLEIPTLSPANGPAADDLADRLAEFNNLPIMFEDDPEIDMGEANLHAILQHILRYGIEAHLADQPRYQVFSNLILYYQPRFRTGFVSPDVMVTTPFKTGNEKLKSYHIGHDGPAPLQVTEILSEETWQRADLNPEGKPFIYAMAGVGEYVLVDPTGEFLSQRLLLKRLQPDRTWKDEHDADGGVTSMLGFRIIWENDGRLRVVDAKSGYRYPRPDEAFLLAQRIHELEAELARLKGKATPPKRKKK